MLKKISSITLLCYFYLSMGIERHETIYIDHVKKSIEHANKGQSKLNNDILKIEGMSNDKVRHVLNNMCSLPEATYLEIGVWRGSTLIAALYNNTNTLADAIAIDNWSQAEGPRHIFERNLSTFLLTNSVRFFNEDCFKLSKSHFIKPVNIYFYDGAHTQEDQIKAFTYFNDVFSDVFIALVDDWNHLPAKAGTLQAFKELQYTVLYEVELPSTEGWWNGLYIAVIKKSK